MNQTSNRTLHQFVFALDRGADALLRHRFGISYSRALALDALLGRAGMTQHELAHVLGRTDPAVSVMLTELTEAGHTVVLPDPAHKRKRRVHLTPAGEQLARGISTLLSEKFLELVERAGIDADAYTGMTQRLYAALTTKQREEG